ncbi:MAG: heavy metal translocating P-type ATPase, partial [Rubrivivax sp.]|nr:heavy metal translocating P-type ATPase [Rubrivivax sp.]
MGIETDEPGRALSCSHCQLPVGQAGQQRTVHGESHVFCCYGCCLAYQLHCGSAEEPDAAAWLIRLGIGGFLAMNIMLFSLLIYAGAFTGDDAWLRQPVHILLWALATPMLVVLGGPFFADAWQALRQGRLVAASLVTVGALAAYGYSALQVWRGSELVYFDTVTMVLLLFTLGRYLEAQGRAHAARDLAPMLAAERAMVRWIGAAGVETRPVAELKAGDCLLVSPGERVAIDGVVVEGHSDCDESALTGQSTPQPKSVGSAVHAGSLNGAGRLHVRATVAGTQTRWVMIGRTVREALATKSLAGDTLDRAAAAFVPAVLLLAAAAAIYWGWHDGTEAALMAGLAVLVVACPCALGLASPLANAMAIGAAAQRGILVRSGAALERLAAIRGVAFDKTGTLTHSALQVLALRGLGADDAALLRHAVALAVGSDHPVARAISSLRVQAATDLASQVQACPGAGVSGQVDGAAAAIGSAKFMASLGWPAPSSLAPASADDGACTRCYVAWAGAVRGRIDLVAAPLPEAPAVLAALQRRGVSIWLLSGDTEGVVARLASALKLQRWHAGLLPQDKVRLLRDAIAAEGPMAMVGDGLNDGPVLAAASVGIAVGGAVDLAKESADIVLPAAGFTLLPWLLDEARRVRRTVRANLAWAFGYNAIALALAAGGLLQPVLAAALMAGSSLVVVLRCWRAQRRSGAALQRGPAPQ